MVSFDVVSLFTKVPVNDLLDFLKEELENYDLPLSITKIIDLVRLCIIDCKFCFNDEFYVQKFGMAMGNPLSPDLSNIYMEYFEKRILQRILPTKVVWYRYVDDIFCVWPIEVNLQDFLTRLNNLVPSIKFTLEKETNCTLSFLDVVVHREDRRFCYSIHRKPTSICSYIHFYSNHHHNVKLSVFSGMFLRALRICSPQFLDGEVEKIYDIALKLKYPSIFIDKAWQKARKTFYSQDERPVHSMINILKLPYDERLLEVPKILKLFNITAVFSNWNVKNIIIRNSPHNAPGCIYKIPCKNCNKTYYGQTSKELSTRIKQHKYSIRTGQTSNALFVHLSDSDHPIDWGEAKPLIFCKDFIKINILESCIIKSSYENNLNLSHGLFKIDALIIKKVSDRYKHLGCF